MKFGKMENIDGVDFHLPADDPGNTGFLASLPDSEFSFYFGCTGWSMKEWVGKVYPKGTKSKDYLYYYSRQFNTIELNTTHYRTPSPDLVLKWQEESAEAFRFCPKVLQTISHSRDLGVGKPALQSFTEAVGALGKKLGACFIQLPPYFGADRLEVLSRFLKAWPDYLPLAVELRHESWFSNPEANRKLIQLLRNTQTGFVITDVAGRRDVLHMAISAPFSMIRFVGNGLHKSDYTRIDEWIERISDWKAKGLQSVYFFPHEPDNLLAPDLGKYLASAVKKNLGLDLPDPSLDGSFPKKDDQSQMSLF